MSKLHLEETWRWPPEAGMHPDNWNILSGKDNGCPRAPCIGEGCITYDEERNKIIRCDYFKVGDLVRHYNRWDRPWEVSRVTEAPSSADEYGIGMHTEAGYCWVYNTE